MYIQFAKFWHCGRPVYRARTIFYFDFESFDVLMIQNEICSSSASDEKFWKALHKAIIDGELFLIVALYFVCKTYAIYSISSFILCLFQINDLGNEYDVQLLVDSSNINSLDENGHPPLHFAAVKGNNWWINSKLWKLNRCHWINIQIKLKKNNFFLFSWLQNIHNPLNITQA